MNLEVIRTVFTLKSVIDISLVSIFIYQIISMLKGTRAAQVLIGILVIFVAYVISNFFQFETVRWIISRFYSSFIIVVVVLFQDDIRRLLSRFGKGPFVSPIDIGSGASVIDEVINSAKTLSYDRTGAIIVFERSIGLDKLYDHSVKIDALVSEQLINSLFHSFSPLHDGAVIIQRNRISCASAQLPLSKNPKFSKKTGTRHSAAVGISEETDAVVIVVSEETGNISIAWEGNLQKQSSPESARKILYALLLPNGIKNPLLVFFEDKIVFHLKKYVNSVYKVAYHMFSNKNYPQKGASFLEHIKIVSLESLFVKQVEEENRRAGFSNPQIRIRLQKGKQGSDLVNIAGNVFLSKEDSSTKVDYDDSSFFAKNEARPLSSVPLKERFDPPVVIATPPSDISIGGISLDKSNEEKIEDENKNSKNKKDS